MGFDGRPDSGAGEHGFQRYPDRESACTVEQHAAGSFSARSAVWTMEKKPGDGTLTTEDR